MVVLFLFIVSGNRSFGEGLAGQLWLRVSQTDSGCGGNSRSLSTWRPVGHLSFFTKAQGLPMVSLRGPVWASLQHGGLRAAVRLRGALRSARVAHEIGTVLPPFAT